MPVRSSQPSVLRTQEFFNRISSVSNETKDRLGVFDFSYRLDLLNLWSNTVCYWPMLKNQNAGVSNTIFGLKNYFDALSLDNNPINWQNEGIYLDGDDFVALEQNPQQALYLEETNGQFISTKNKPLNIGNIGEDYDPKENSFMVVVKPNPNSFATGSLNIRNTGSFDLALDRIYDTTDQLCNLDGVLLEDANNIATNCFYNTFKFSSSELDGFECLGRYCLDWKWVARQSDATFLTTWTNTISGGIYEKQWSNPDEEQCALFVPSVNALNVQLSVTDLDFTSIVYTNEGGINGNKGIQINNSFYSTNNPLPNSFTDFYGISFDVNKNRWFGNVCFYVQFATPLLSGTLPLYTAYKETLGRSLELP
jgi:hypothetical protein